MLRQPRLRTLAAGFALLPAAVAADALPDPDLSPLISGIGLPRADEGARLLAPGDFSVSATWATASHAVDGVSGDEQLLFDGETSRLSVRFDYRLNERLQLGVELPYVLQESGGLDNVVDTWHGWFGFPNGIRDDVPQDDLRYFYDDGTERLNFRQNARGIGDVRLLAAWPVESQEGTARAIRLSLKLPTGDAAQLTGSGATDLALMYAVDRDGLGGKPDWRAHFRGGLVLVGEPDRAGDRARPLIGVVEGGVGWRVHERLELAAQARLRSAAYDSGVAPVGGTAALLNVGGTIFFSKRLRLSIAVGEDVRVKSAPDVTFALRLRYNPAADR